MLHMRIGKLVTSLSKKTVPWLKASGKTNILQTKPVNNTNIKELKYIPTYTPDTISINTTEYFYAKFKNKLKSLATDKDGNFIYRKPDKTELVEISKGEEHLYDSYLIEPDGKMYYEKFLSKGDDIKFNIDKEFKPLNEDVGILVHGTSKEAYTKILKEGFKTSKRFAETFPGIYFTRLIDGKNNYGEKQIKCVLNGKVATGDIRKISDFIYGPTKIDDFLKSGKFNDIDPIKLKQLLLMDEFLVRGYKGVYSNTSMNFAKCKSLVVFNNNDLKIIL